MPTIHASFQTPQYVGNVEVVKNVRVDVTEPLVKCGKIFNISYEIHFFSANSDGHLLKKMKRAI